MKTQERSVEEIVEEFAEADRRAGMTKKLIVNDLHDVDGKSFTEIGNLLGLSRQRAHQIYHGNKR